MLSSEAINLPPAFLTPSIQEYHTRNCLMFKKHTNLRSLEETQRLAPHGSFDRS
ncbi:hypothetical protein [Leptospira noguchii]|uniref:hypothetical protein n=1 Tax=Leptospira noguchii TaxID=28182 RepID=UPI001FB7AB26|nr:hypothetical protein [Leptospira noguchii]UOG53741.1 hypothetical protein MAL09_06330 [Leptospira noguchii]